MPCDEAAHHTNSERTTIDDGAGEAGGGRSSSAPVASSTSEAGSPAADSAPAPPAAPEGFTLGLALMDSVPVLLFFVGVVAIALRFKNGFFLIGALICVAAGCSKVLWKLLVAARDEDHPQLTWLFRHGMLCGFFVMLISVLLALVAGSLSLAKLAARIVSFPAAVFFALGLAGLAAMGVLAAKLDGRVARNNWIEQLVNTCAQAAILAGILLC